MNSRREHKKKSFSSSFSTLNTMHSVTISTALGPSHCLKQDENGRYNQERGVPAISFDV